MEDKESFRNRYKCPSCLTSWWVLEELDMEGSPTEKPCEWCIKNRPTSLQLLHRMIDIFDTTLMSDFPIFIKQLVKHIDLK